MSYTKHTWQTGEIITAENLNHMEQGIKDAPGYSVENTTIAFVDQTVTPAQYGHHYQASLSSSISGYPNDITVTFNGTEYAHLEPHSAYYDAIYYGEMQDSNISPIFTTYPFLILYNYYGSGNWEIYTEEAGTCTVKLETVEKQTTITDDFDLAVLTASKSFNLSDRIIKGVNNDNYVEGAVVQGNIKNNVAIGQYSHAEGFNTNAGTYCAHTEGTGTTASGSYSHAEGASTTASGSGTHAEGTNTTASGTCAHAEGSNTTASGYYSHAEGSGATASGYASHAEGSGTTAAKNYQHVFGTNNIVDTGDTGSGKGTYVEIVGNGTDWQNLSNARTLDWSGNEKIAGSLTLGLGTANEVTISPTQLAALLALLN